MPTSPLPTIGRKPVVKFTPTSVIVAGATGYVLRESKDPLDILYDALKAYLTKSVPATPLGPAAVRVTDPAIFNFGFQLFPAGKGGLASQTVNAAPGLTSDPMFVTSYDFTDPAVPAAVATAISLPGLSRAEFDGTVLDSFGTMGPACDAIQTAATELMRDVFGSRYELGKILSELTFLANGRFRPIEDYVTFFDRVENAVAGSSISSQYHAVATAFLMTCAVRLDRVRDVFPVQIVSGLRTTILRPSAHLPTLYVERALDGLAFDSQSLQTRDLGDVASAAHVTSYIGKCCDAVRTVLGQLRMRIHALPRVLESHTFSTYYSARDIDIFDWRELDGTINFIPRAAYVVPPSKLELGYLAPEVAYLAEVIASGSSRTPLQKISTQEFVNRFRVIEERVPVDDRRPYCLVAIEPNYKLEGRLTAVFDATDTGGAGRLALRVFSRLPHEEVLNYESAVTAGVAALDSFAEMTTLVASELGPTNELIFGGDAFMMFAYAASVSDEVQMRTSDTPAAQLVAGYESTTSTEIRFRGRIRADAPHASVGVALPLEARGRAFETTNAATMAVLSAARPASGPAPAAWVIRDDLPPVLAERPKAFFHAAASIPGLPITRSFAGRLLTATLMTPSGPDGVLLSPVTASPIEVRLADIARLPGFDGVRLLVHRGMALAQYVQAYRVGRIINRWQTYGPGGHPGLPMPAGATAPSLWNRVPVESSVKSMLYNQILATATTYAGRRSGSYEVGPVTLADHIVDYNGKRQSIFNFMTTLFGVTAPGVLFLAGFLTGPAASATNVETAVAKGVYAGF